ncbi:MAG TPA: LuxR C-terminal-related transcriptional regulator, partial [Gemmatimonadales bacterium]|nr:LuxR C-terminal-related transcriptional regulator [Gemmatimonadales bacterium]
EVEAARDTLAEAAAGFDRAGAPYDALRARLFLAEQLQTTGELKAAAREAGTVARGAKQLGARSLERRAATLGRTTASRGGASSRLTRREGEVLGQVAQGLTNRQIATRLGVSEHTVHRHLANIFTRLGLSSRAAAVAYAVRQGMG